MMFARISLRWIMLPLILMINACGASSSVAQRGATISGPLMPPDVDVTPAAPSPEIEPAAQVKEPAQVEEDDLYEEERGVVSGLDLLRELPPSSPVETGADGMAFDPGEFDIPISTHPRVIEAVNTLRTSGFRLFSEWMNRAKRYAPMIRSIFERDGLPQDLSFIALIGSGYHPRAIARSDAGGLWQIPRETARTLSLVQTEWVDERYDPKKSTLLVADHFRRLYQQLGDWTLVMAAHFSDEASVREQMASSGVSDYWRMALPEAAMQAVPFIMAAAIISRHPDAYGFNIQSDPPLTYETVVIDRSLHLGAIAEGMEISLALLQLLNPELRAWRIPPDGYTLRIPVGTRYKFLAWTGAPPSTPPPLDLALYTVRRGDTISSIARRYRVTINDIIIENDIPRPNRLKIGQVLFIPVPADKISSYTRKPPAPPQSPPRETAGRSAPPPAGTQITHRVRWGETLESIGRRYNVSVSQLQQWNGIRDPRGLQAGSPLKIWIPESRRSADSSSNDEIELPMYYTVRPGDTLWDIAQLFGLSVSFLRDLNGLNARTVIHPGDRLKIGAP